MNYQSTPHFDRKFRKFPQIVQKAFRKQIRFLIDDIRYPSLCAKKYDDTWGIWQARVTNNVRFYFQIVDGTYRILDIEKHRD